MLVVSVVIHAEGFDVWLSSPSISLRNLCRMAESAGVVVEEGADWRSSGCSFTYSPSPPRQSHLNM